MRIEPFKLERYFAKYEFSAPYLLSCSDCEPLILSELLAMASEEDRKQWDNLWLGYTESLGKPELRNEIAELYTGSNPDEFLVVVPEEGIFIAMNTMLEASDSVVTTFPAYQSLYSIAKGVGCKVSQWMPQEDGSFCVSDLENLVDAKTKLIVINFPHNPTGELIDRKQLDEIIAIAKSCDAYVFMDEMYRYLEYKPSTRLPSVAELYHKGICLSGLSKSFALPGLRIGWLRTKNQELYAKLAAFKDYTTICSSAPSELLGIIALKNKKEILSRNLEIISKNLENLEKFIEQNSNLFRWKKPIAGPICFPEFLGSQPVDTFCENLVSKAGIMLVPSTVFDFSQKRVRFGFGRKNFSENLNKLQEFIEAN